MLKKILIFFGVIVLVLVAVMAGAYYYFIRLPLPVIDGEIGVQGLEAPVEILRDQWGVPHIYAKTNQDLCFAQGFVQAQDRLWQMALNRRLVSGRFSEIIGPEAVSVDRLMRTLGIMRAAREEIATYDQDTMALLQAFANGVNAFIESCENRLPVEFRVLGVSPEPWRPEDSIGWAKLMALFGACDWEEELVTAMLVQRLGIEKANTLYGLMQRGTPTIVPFALDRTSIWPASPLMKKAFLPSLGGASNNWVVHGSRSKTGSPLLVNDMHLDVSIPSIWYEIHLAGGDFDVAGLSLPSIPFIIAGHNRDVAWGITFALTDTQDLFLERLNPDQPDQYLYKGEWRNAERIRESIHVKGRNEPIVYEVLKTIHGPIISPHISAAKGLKYAISLRWSAYDPGGMSPAFIRMNLAKDLSEFKDAALKCTDPSINLVCADRNGAIGYILGGRVPIRPRGHGGGPFPGWTGDHEWIGYLPDDKKPFLINPVTGFIATANNRVVGDDYPFYLANHYMPGYRAERIQEVMGRASRISTDDCRTLQGDLKCPEAVRFMKALKDIKGKSPEAKDLLARLHAWDRTMVPESTGGAIYSVLFFRLMENTFADELGDLTERFFGLGLTPLAPFNTFATHSRVALINLLSDPASPWFDDVTTSDKEDLNHVMEKSLYETASFLRQAMGPDPSGWRWGRLHQIEFQHPLGRVKPLDRIFNRGPFETGGNFSTVWASTYLPGMDFGYKGWTVSQRHIYDLQDWDKSLGAIVPGQSGMLGSPHYSDQIKLWRNADHHPLYFSRASVEAASTHRLILKPLKD